MQPPKQRTTNLAKRKNKKDRWFPGLVKWEYNRETQILGSSGDLPGIPPHIGVWIRKSAKSRFPVYYYIHDVTVAINGYH